MKLVTERDLNQTSDLAFKHNFRLYDDNGNLVPYVKSVSFKIDASTHEQIMVIEKYVRIDDVDIEVPDEQVKIIQA